MLNDRHRVLIRICLSRVAKIGICYDNKLIWRLKRINTMGMWLFDRKGNQWVLNWRKGEKIFGWVFEWSEDRSATAVYILARVHGSQEKEEEGKEEKEGIRPSGLSDPHLRGPRPGHSQGLTHHPTHWHARTTQRPHGTTPPLPHHHQNRKSCQSHRQTPPGKHHQCHRVQG